MKKTIFQIIEQHHEIVNHFLKLQQQIDELAKVMTLIGLEIEDLKRHLQEKDENNTLHNNGDVN